MIAKTAERFMRPGPDVTLEFRRICALPRRDWGSASDLEHIRSGLTDYLKTPEGTMELRPSQAAALRDAHDFRGLFAPLGVGEGKSLITLLAPVLLEAKNPMLLVPAQTREQTKKRVIPEMRAHWRLHPRLRVIGYSELSLAKNKSLLFDFQPDLLIADECHFLKNLASGRTRRVSRFMDRFPETPFLALSGTVTNHSIMDYWHIIQWALKPHRSPVPGGWREARVWADALDARIDPGVRRKGGALWSLAQTGSSVRERYQKRLVQTNGVVASSNNTLGTSLLITGRPLKAPESVYRRVQDIMDTFETPCGYPLGQASEVWDCARTTLCGFHYEWDPAPPKRWLRVRKAWKQYVRHRIKYNKKQIDTELQVFNEALYSESPPKEWQEWVEVKDSFEPNPVPIWFHSFLVEDAADWLRKNDGICWVEHIEFGKELSRYSGYRYYGAGDNDIISASGPVIASIRAHMTGKNLQHQWHKNLVSCPPSSGTAWEQMMGRTHRQGQPEDTVTVEVYQHHYLFKEALRRAVADAQFQKESMGADQRLLYADRSVP